MPTYDYECPDCGPFTEMVPMAAYDRPQPCPDCQMPAPRLLTVPAIGGMVAEPGSTTPARAHAGGCACCSAPRRFRADAV